MNKKGVRKVRNKVSKCTHCSSEFLAADVKASICPSCLLPITTLCSCGCQVEITRPTYEVNRGNTYKSGHSQRGKTYLQLYGTSDPLCGFKKGDLNIAKRPEVSLKISKSLKAGRHWSVTCPEKVKRRTSKLEGLIAPYLLGWERNYPIGPYSVDFALVAEKKIIEINGCYWHNCMPCGYADKVEKSILALVRNSDQKRTNFLTSKGWSIEVVWEHSIPAWISQQIHSSKLTITRYHDICAGHRVVNHEGKCVRLHGHNYRIFFTCVATRLDSVGRVIDFSVVKELLCDWLEEHWDHKFLVWEKDPFKTSLRNIDKSVVVVPFNPTAENIAQYLVEKVGPKQLKKTGVHLLRVKVEETRKCSATVELTAKTNLKLVYPNNSDPFIIPIV